MDKLFELYKEQGISQGLLKDIEAFRRKYPVDERAGERVAKPEILFYGKEIFEMAATALLQGENILLSGTKATGKNVLAENLAWVFGRPVYNISFNVNTDSTSLIGTDTFRNNEVCLRRGPVYDCADYGGFGIFDEINMAKNDAVSVLHAALDYRRTIDVPGYDRIRLHDAARFIGTMNYGYAGTKELNEALVSRFMVIDMPPVELETLHKILKDIFPDARDEGLEQLCGFFMDLQLKASHNEISTKALDLRGLIGAVKTIRAGLSPALALRMGIVNKSFDIFEREIIEDIVETRIPEGWSSADVFEVAHEI
ncbi:MAG: MoxR family ATPase [Eubacteriales bacterium]|nr:MoxR family ATPase [Eubacteriales bacterium]